MTAFLGHEAGPSTSRIVNPMSGQSIGREGPFGINIGQDKNNPDRYAVYIGASGLNLPGPEYYTEPGLSDLKSAYTEYVSAMLALLNWPDAKTRAAEIVALETQIAKVSWSHQQMRNA